MTRWQQLYLEKEVCISVPPSQTAQIAANLFVQNNKRNILDIGCGVGRDSHYFSQLGFSVVGVDMAMSGLEIADKLRQEKQLTTALAQVDARSLPFKTAVFDAIYCFGMLHEFTGKTCKQDVQSVMQEIERVLMPDGLLILSVLSGDPAAGMPHVRFFTETMFDEVTNTFKRVSKQEFNDLGCTGRPDYKVWTGAFAKPGKQNDI